MNTRWLLAAALLAVGLAAPADARHGKAAQPVDWKAVITTDDLGRLHKWREAFVQALSEARAAGFGAAIASEGALLDPDSALESATLPGGRYRCRVLKLGSTTRGAVRYSAAPALDCRVADEGGVLSFTKMDGTQRPVGLVFNNDPRRNIFLGTVMFSDETSAIDYGRDAARDLVGAVERVGDKRWRMILPYPHFESVLDVIELVPAG